MATVPNDQADVQARPRIVQGSVLPAFRSKGTEQFCAASVGWCLWRAFSRGCFQP